MFYDHDRLSRDNVVPAAPSRPMSLHSSYSTGEIPTANNNDIGSPKACAEPFRQLNNDIRRISLSAGNGRPSDNSPERSESRIATTPPQQTPLQASAAPFGPQLASPATTPGSSVSATPAVLPSLQSPFYGYGLQAYMGSPPQVNTQTQTLSSPYSGYGAYGNYRFAETPNKSTSSRRNGETESPQVSRFSNFPLEHYRGELYGLCKDQHGCRYLQRKLEEQNPENVQLIFSETYAHVVELMTGLSRLFLVPLFIFVVVFVQHSD